MFKKYGRQETEKTFFALGTVNCVKIYEGGSRFTVNKAVSRVCEIEKRMSAFRKESDISQLREKAGSGFLTVHPDTFELIRRAVDFSYRSKGVFDITIGPLTELWGIGRKGNHVPDDAEIEKAKALVNFQDVLLNKRKQGVVLRKPGQSLDLGSIAKGYAAEEVKRILLEDGVKSAMINLGGNVVVVGRKPGGEPWHIGIQNPLASTGNFVGILSAADQTIVTSGVNERFFIKNGVRYHHILDPCTGAPAQSDLLSVTAVCGNSVDADAITTVLFILGEQNSRDFLKDVGGEAIFIYRDLSVTVTEGLLEDLELIPQEAAI